MAPCSAKFVAPGYLCLVVGCAVITYGLKEMIFNYGCSFDSHPCDRYLITSLAIKYLVLPWRYRINLKVKIFCWTTTQEFSLPSAWSLDSREHFNCLLPYPSVLFCIGHWKLRFILVNYSFTKPNETNCNTTFERNLPVRHLMAWTSLICNLKRASHHSLYSAAQALNALL